MLRFLFLRKRITEREAKAEGGLVRMLVVKVTQVQDSGAARDGEEAGGRGEKLGLNLWDAPC